MILRFLATLVVASGTAFAHAADPQPLWEIDCASLDIAQEGDKTSVQWIGLSPDGKIVVAQIAYRRVVKGFTGVEYKEYLVAWSSATHKELWRVALGAGGWHPGRRTNAVSERGTILIPSAKREVRFADGKTRGLNLESEIMRLSAYRESGGDGLAWVNRDNVIVAFLNNSWEHFDIVAGTLRFFDNAPTEDPLTLKGRVALQPDQKDFVICAVTVSPDAAYLAVSAGPDRIQDGHLLRLYSLAVGDTVKLTEVATVPKPHRGCIECARFSPDNKTLATGSGDGSIALWDVSKAGKGWKPRATIPAGNFSVSCFAFSPDGRTLATGTWDAKGRPNLWMIDVTGGKLVSSYRFRGEVTEVAYSPDGKLLVTGDSLGLLRVWEAAAIRGD